MEFNFYDEYLVFSFDWNDIQSNDIRLERQLDGTFETLDTGLFNETGNYNFCWKPPYINYDGYIKASDSFWRVRDVPIIKKIQRSPSVFVFNRKLESFILIEEAPQDSQFYLFEDSTDWDSSNQLKELEISADRNILRIWFPESRYNSSYHYLVYQCIFVGEEWLQQDTHHGKEFNTQMVQLWALLSLMSQLIEGCCQR